MAKITYLFGAGASANAIPVVSDMNYRISELTKFLSKERISKAVIEGVLENSISTENLNYANKFDEIIKELSWLSEESGNYYSIDTLAKKFYLTGDNNYQRLKNALIIYFSLEQYMNIPSSPNKDKGYLFVKNPIDKRYSNFIASIARKRYPIAGGNHDFLAAENLSFGLNENIKIISWNYDVQFELNLKPFTNTIIQHIKSNFQIFPNKTTVGEVNKSLIDLDKFGIVKLNGDAIWHRRVNDDYKKTIFDDKIDTNERKLLINFLDEYKTSDLSLQLSKDSISPTMCFNFAWESDSNFIGKYKGHTINLEKAEKIAAETEILVVIGYSFPIFNREIDDRLFKKMENLKKVYIQDLEPENIKSTMQNAFEILQRKVQVNFSVDYKIEEEYLVGFSLNKNINQFIIPYELNQ